MRILLVYPRFFYPTGDPPLGILYLASYLKKNVHNIELKLFDGTFLPSMKKLEAIISDFKPEIIGIYCNTLMYQYTLKIGEIGKNNGATVVVGGPHATIAPGSLLKYRFIDYAVIGEGEEVFEYFINNHANSQKLNAHPSIVTRANLKKNDDFHNTPIEDLDSIPFPAYHLLDMEKYIENWFQMDIVSPNLRGTNIVASRGCPYHCTFCQPTLNKIFGKKTRIRSPENVIEELKYLKRKYRLNSFIFTDDTPTFFKKWMIQFSKLLIKEKLNFKWGCNTRIGLLDVDTMKIMVKSGLRRIMVGVESANQRILDDIYKKGIKVKDVNDFCKKAKNLGIKVFAYFMLGAPTETIPEIKKTIFFASRLPIHEATFSIATPLPGTELEKIMKEKGYLINQDFTKFDYYSSISYKSKISPLRLRFFQRVTFLIFYLNIKRILYLLRSFSTLSAIKKTLLKLRRLI